MLIRCEELDVIIREKDLDGFDGRIYKNRIAINRKLESKTKACVLAEELGHFFMNSGNILDQTKENNRKQELKARRWSYDKLIGLQGIVVSFEAGCQSIDSICEFLEISEEFLKSALNDYRHRYGVSTRFEEYVIYFEPGLAVFKFI